MESEEDTYRFDPDRAQQGLAVIIVNLSCGQRIRKGASCDLENMQKMFKQLGFEVECHTNVTKSKLTALLVHYSESGNIEKYSCFAFGISSHGMEVEHEEKEAKKIVNHHAILTFDGAVVYTKDIIDYFSHEKCRALRNKPKLFFIQACRIPESRSTQEHRDCGIGYDHGALEPRHENQGQWSSRDQTDYQETEVKDSVEGDNVSDTNDENDHPPAAIHDTCNEDQEGIGEIEQDLERAQLGNQTKELGRANPNKEQNAQVAANQNKENDPLPVANHSKEKTSSMVTGDEVDTEGRRLDPAGGDTSGDLVDAPKGTRYSTNPIHIVLVPCHKDMLIMFGSPPGYYAIRSKTDGSYMFKYLNEAVEEHYGNGHLRGNQTSFLDVLLDVAARMAERTYFDGKKYTIVPCLVHKLSKDIVFTEGKKMISEK